MHNSEWRSPSQVVSRACFETVPLLGMSTWEGHIQMPCQGLFTVGEVLPWYIEGFGGN